MGNCVTVYFMFQSIGGNRSGGRVIPIKACKFPLLTSPLAPLLRGEGRISTPSRFGKGAGGLEPRFAGFRFAQLR